MQNSSAPVLASRSSKAGPFSGDVYRYRNPSQSAYYRCVQDHFEQLEAVWPDCYEQRYGFWRSYVRDVIYRYLDCGDLNCGFARVRCDQCGHEYLLAFSCKRRHFCPSCHQKRVVAFSERLVGQVLKKVPHRQWVFSIPKRLRIYFLFDRKLLAKLSRCAWKVLKTYLAQGSVCNKASPGAVVAVHTFGEFQRFNPHLHVIATDGCFSDIGIFNIAPTAKTADVQELFRHEVFKMLKAEGKITDAVIENMMAWRHSGFNVYCGPTIWPDDPDAIEDLARYIVRACFSQERMTYKLPTVTPRSSIAPRTAASRKPSTPWIGSPNWSHIFPIRASRWFAIMAIIPTKPEACAKRRNVTTIRRH